LSPFDLEQAPRGLVEISADLSSIPIICLFLLLQESRGQNGPAGEYAFNQGRRIVDRFDCQEPFPSQVAIGECRDWRPFVTRSRTAENGAAQGQADERRQVFEIHIISPGTWE
jgi:hypothetical protein